MAAVSVFLGCPGNFHVLRNAVVIFSFCALFLKVQPVQNQEVMETSLPSEMRRLRGDLLKDYDRTARPAKNRSAPTDLLLFFDVTHIVNLDEKFQILTVKGELMMEWKDEHLKWDPDSYRGIPSIRMKSQEIWVPTIFSVYNVKASQVLDRVSSAVLLYSNGTVKWRPEAVFDVPCNTRLRHYPFDSHNCSILLNAWTLSTEITMGILRQPKSSSSSVKGTAWTLTKAEHEFMDQMEFYKSHVIVVKLFLERTSRIYRYVCVAPTLVTLLTSVFGFWLLPGDSSRYMIGCSNVILMSLGLQNLAVTVPAGKDIPLIAAYSAAFLCMSGAFLLVTAITDLLRESSGTPPQAVLRFVRRHLERHLCVNLVVIQASDRILKEVNSGSPDGATVVSPEEEKRRKDWVYTSLVVDRISFFVFVLTYGILLGVLASV